MNNYAERIHGKNKYILFVGSLPKSVREDIQDYISEKKKTWNILVLHDGPTEHPDDIAFDYANEKAIKEFFDHYGKHIICVTTRGEKNIPLFQTIIPFLPEHLNHPSVDSLEKATQKTKMRQAFWKYDKSITPRFHVIKEYTKTTVDEISNKLEFPVIIKPSGLALGMLVQSAHYPEELKKVLDSTFKKINANYKRIKGRGEPAILVEEIIEGDQYSVDALIDNSGTVSFCPFVKYVKSSEKGFDDFFSYEQKVPATISKESLEQAKEVATKGIHALGLTNSSAHIEMIRSDNHWYIVEIGPRVGGFRSVMYKKSFNIDLDIQDLNVRMGKPVNVHKKKQGYTSFIKFYPKKEGVITKITGIKKAQSLESFLEVKQNLKKGDRARFAKNGGDCVFRVTLFHKNKAQWIADKRKLEKIVSIETIHSQKN